MGRLIGRARYRDGVFDDLIAAAGTAPARSDNARWRQAALLGLAAALGADCRADLAASLCALDLPHAAQAALATPTTPWERWWALMAAGQIDADGLAARVEDAARVPDRGPDAREVRRRMSDLHDELMALAGGSAEDARFAVRGTDAGPPRRALLVGRSSAAFIVDPAWEGFRLVRLGPSEGPIAGNRAHHSVAEIIELVRRGDAGAQQPVPPDAPAVVEPAAMLEALREAPGVRERELADLAREVREERADLTRQRTALQAQRDKLRHALDEVQALRAREASGVNVPTSLAQACAVLELPPGSPSEAVERAYREQIARVHPDRVAGLHADIQSTAEALTVALNAARDLMLGAGRPSRR